MMNRGTECRFITLAILAVMTSPFLCAQNRLVNMIPQALSAESWQDSEPTLAIDPNDYSHMAGSAFFPLHVRSSKLKPLIKTPIYVSADRGATWTLAYIVPTQAGPDAPIGDITLSFGTTLSGAPLHQTGWLYAGILRAPQPYRMVVLRTNDFLSGVAMSPLDTQPQPLPPDHRVDQPHTRALGDGFGHDKLYVGFNNGVAGWTKVLNPVSQLWSIVCTQTVPNGRSASIDVTLDATTANPAVAPDLIEWRNVSCADGAAVVPAPHPDGTIYAAFINDVVSGTPQLVVVRDDNWGNSLPFSFWALGDPSDSTPGRLVESPLTLPDEGFVLGQNRLGSSNLSIAVDPGNSNRVYLAYGDGSLLHPGSAETIHVRRSTDRGHTWSADLLTVEEALNPEIAINTAGTVGLLYQRVVSNRWETRLTRTTDADATVFDNPGLLLANTDAINPLWVHQPYLGDYASLLAAGRNFFGMFSASNYPDKANFLPGVQYQRYVDWDMHKLYADAAHTTEVPISIDPFFFEVDALPPDKDFYVRDWTTDANHADNGVEPSTNPVFYSSSDVWNRNSTNPGNFPADQPVNEDPVSGFAAAGDNWAFARIRRNVPGAPDSITAHFLVAKYGAGSNFEDASSILDQSITFDPDPVVNTDAGTGPWITPPFHWHLNPISGNHLCLAVEISAPDSPYIPPSLANTKASLTDIRIVNDNHKAMRLMRRMGVPGAAIAPVVDYAIVHNNALFARDITLRVNVPPASGRFLRSVIVRAVDASPKPAMATAGRTLILRNVSPGENRWVKISILPGKLSQNDSAYLNVDDVVGYRTVSGFAVEVRSELLESAIRHSMATYQSTAQRLAEAFGAHASSADVDVKPALAAEEFVAFLHNRLVPHLEADLQKAGAFSAADLFHLRSSLAVIGRTASAPQLSVYVDSLLNGIDAYLTMRQLQRGDPADIIQMVRWQKQLFLQQPRLAKLSCAAKIVAASDEFLAGRESGRLTNAAYPNLLEQSSGCLQEGSGLHNAFTGTDLVHLEKLHRDYLFAISK